MPLRNPNSPYVDSVVAGALGIVMAGYPSANTQVGINSYPIRYDAAYDTYKGAFPAVLISVAAQHYQRASRSTWQGEVTFFTDYYDRWDQRPDELDTIRANIAADLERMKANVESNESLAQNNTAYAISAYKHELSPYEGYFREVNGMKLIYRRYTVSFFLLPYDS